MHNLGMTYATNKEERDCAIKLTVGVVVFSRAQGCN